MDKNQPIFSQASIHYGILIAICFFSFFIHNRMIPADIMEARNLATAQEMVHYGNYLLPTMNGELRLEKPPLPTWIAAGIEHVAAGNLVAQRCATGMMGFLMVLFLYLIVSRLSRNRNTGLIAALILATCINVILMARTATWDIYTHAFMLGAIYFLILALEEKGVQWKNFILSGVLMGLSFLSKGPVSFYALFLPFLIGYITVYRPSVRKKVWPLISMIVVCLLVSFWWVLYVWAFHSDLLISVGQKESSSWLNHNVRPWYYYWQFPAEAGMWTLFWVTSIVYFFVDKKETRPKESIFSFIWFLASLILLSAIPEKKTRYLLPLLIPGAMMIGFYFRRMLEGMKSKVDRSVFRINTIIIAMILIALPIALYILFYKEKQLSLFLLIIIGICAWGVSFYLFRSLFGKKGIQVASVFKGLILAMVVVKAFCLIPIGKMFINEERHSIRLLRDHTELQSLPFYHNREEPLRIELVYEANQRITEIDLSDKEAIYKATPFVLLSGQPIDSLLAGRDLIIEPVGTFDNNWRKKDHKRYNPELVKEVAIIRKK
ncbi:4-amino-4-deoxy-L-arabinose transferase-like glycosyltransferase [Parabacteroides sp. PF5-5]|uniref:ArnT family glycosyltransferase n=1 Tax=unclassified Parabacteroides TaxID=2649774 RepID=UPI002473EF48|nr:MULTISPECIES: glycosyltransferase family 39 protein [unclassified Parabacteroides]MDH6304100.1 4-amino-4-deoxy-L-arabinose transferase-like glycosyltransferase [Parabacteroides sp. PH5-39]MDH6315200.1 4-amino-4-deoxy-L-arabinose transferase-like glycosyltransferase [Parabacteroides sp. PF5-13]MDH6318845.1 4-amino-4-deoxy-L-arabinose transferase-like glycosyltransferase [Parabacteroides sp. PH5-13]MDH6322574.1 4-amino-4-deoxy-L-arabinose transferase-like glycosyltransferase [Parabacteroides s